MENYKTDVLTFCCDFLSILKEKVALFKMESLSPAIEKMDETIDIINDVKESMIDK